MTDKEFSDKLNNWRTELRAMIAERSLREAAEEIGLSHMTVARVLNGQTPSLKVFWQINGWITYEQREAASAKRAATIKEKKRQDALVTKATHDFQCGHCEYEESNGRLVRRCDSCQLKFKHWINGEGQELLPPNQRRKQ